MGSGIMIDRLNFSGSEHCCVLMVDIADSTKTVFQISSSEKLRLFYQLFITEMSSIAASYGAVIIKNAGDGIICYFPETKDPANAEAFKRVVKCGLRIIRGHKLLNLKFQAEGLPAIDYRVSADFGSHEIVTDEKSAVCDIFSSTVNICSKIKLKLCANQLVIGSDLYEIVKKFSQFTFKQKGEFSVDPKHAYPLFVVSEFGGHGEEADTLDRPEDAFIPGSEPLVALNGLVERTSRKGGEQI
jgi:class 3 adenylate cyclase